MQITAKVKAGSRIDRHWRITRQLAGQLAHTLFRLTPEGFVAEMIDPVNLRALMANPSVQVEIYMSPPEALHSAFSDEPVVLDPGVIKTATHAAPTAPTAVLQPQTERTKRPYNKRANG